MVDIKIQLACVCSVAIHRYLPDRLPDTGYGRGMVRMVMGQNDLGQTGFEFGKSAQDRTGFLARIDQSQLFPALAKIAISPHAACYQSGYFHRKIKEYKQK